MTSANSEASMDSEDLGRAVDVTIAGVSSDWKAEFARGDVLFDLVLRESDGLGPLYSRQSCSSCHAGALRGPGFVQKFSVMLPDGTSPAPDQSALRYGHTSRPFVAAGAKIPVEAPPTAGIRVSTRLGPPVVGRGYLEAILDSEIERLASLQAAAGGTVRGRVNHVAYASAPNPDGRFHRHAPGEPLIGRFGLKARIATLDEFAADALQGDMGITSVLRPAELPNPDGLEDDAKPGLDATADDINLRADYTRLIAIPPRAATAGRGSALFDDVACSACHVPAMRTRSDYPVEVIANVDAPVYTDLLLHDMGSGLSDGLGESDGEAGPRDWRTAPLMGLRYARTYLHDGRAKTLREAILMHDSEGSEAHDSVERFSALSESEQRDLLAFVAAL